MDVILYAVEKSVDAYKFGLLHNKQLFIRQLKTNNMGSRTIDEGAIDEKSGMNFSEYVAVLSGNTEMCIRDRHNVRHILQEARAKVIHHVNSTLVRAYWQVGKYIVEYEQQGTDRAGYGKAVINTLSRRLVAEFGNGFTATNRCV